MKTRPDIQVGKHKSDCTGYDFAGQEDFVAKKCPKMSKQKQLRLKVNERVLVLISGTKCDHSSVSYRLV